MFFVPVKWTWDWGVAENTWTDHSQGVHWILVNIGLRALNRLVRISSVCFENGMLHVVVTTMVYMIEWTFTISMISHPFSFFLWWEVQHRPDQTSNKMYQDSSKTVETWEYQMSNTVKKICYIKLSYIKTRTYKVLAIISVSLQNTQLLPF